MNIYTKTQNKTKIGRTTKINKSFISFILFFRSDTLNANNLTSQMSVKLLLGKFYQSSQLLSLYQPYETVCRPLEEEVETI